MEYIFSFFSRNGALKFADAVKSAGGSVKIVNAPAGGGSGCGLGVSCRDYSLCRDTLGFGHYSALRAVYSFDGKEYKQIYNVN